MSKVIHWTYTNPVLRSVALTSSSQFTLGRSWLHIPINHLGCVKRNRYVIIFFPVSKKKDFPGGPVVKTTLPMQSTQVWSLVGEGNGTPLQHSCLENSMDGGSWWATVYGVSNSRTRLSDFTFTFYFHALEKDMATHSTVLAWRIPGTGSLAGCRLGVAQSRTWLKRFSSRELDPSCLN